MNISSSCAAARAAVAVAFFSLLAGCGSTNNRLAGDVLRISVEGPDNRILVESKAVTLGELPKRLRHVGARPATEIFVAVPHNVTPAAMSAISGKLRAAGYQKVIFVKPQRAESLTGG